MAVYELLILTVLISFAGVMIWAAVSDVRAFTIPNAVSLTGLALFIPFALAVTIGYDAVSPAFWLGNLAVAAVVFTVGLLLFHFGMMGGGDIKLISTISLWAGPGLILIFLLTTSLAGGLVAVLSLANPRKKAVAAGAGTAETPGETAIAHKIPYGVAIAVGGLAVTAIWWFRL